jgi:hypothetical protein
VVTAVTAELLKYRLLFVSVFTSFTKGMVSFNDGDAMQ